MNHSKALPNFAPNPYHRFYPRLCTNCARMGYCIVTVHIGAAIRTSAPAGAISLAPTIELYQRFALHLQPHLRIFLEDLRVALAEHLGHPLVGSWPR